MRPGVPHYVYGVENTIIHGGHFYCVSQMQATVDSLVHTFILSDFISNTFHHPSRELLRRIVVFWALGLLQHPFSANGIIGAHFYSPPDQIFRRRAITHAQCSNVPGSYGFDFRLYSCSPR